LVFSPDAVFVRQDQILGRAGTDLLVASDGTVITAGEVGTREAAGYPLHIRTPSFSVRRSFGLRDPTLDPRQFAATGDERFLYLLRELAPADASSFWTYNPTRFLLERYGNDGNLLGRYRHALDGWYAESTRSKPSVGEFNGLALQGVQQSADPDIVWLIYHAARPGFGPLQPGARSVWQTLVEGHDLVVEAWDQRRNEIVAMGRVPQTLAFPVRHAPDMLALIRPEGDEVHKVQVVVLGVSQRQP
jgi:hypothetical protein